MGVPELVFWYLRQLFQGWQSWSAVDRGRLESIAVWLVIGTSIFGNFFAAWLARWLRYRRAIALLCFGYGLSMLLTFGVPRSHDQLWLGLTAIGVCQGVFALFTMYLPPLFPTLLRTTGAGFCYNISRIAAGFGTVIFGLLSYTSSSEHSSALAHAGDYRLALVYAGCLFFPAAAIAWMLPDLADEDVRPASPLAAEQVELAD